ncbi:MAG: PEPxxWA-CTERM sorting domain-containing protein [Sphingomonadaceae bacterium]
MLKFTMAAAALLVAGGANAATVLFSDDFEAETPRLAESSALAQWEVIGNVDIVGMPNPFGITCSGNCVDLDGTTGPGRILSNDIAFSAGGVVRIQFDLSGSQRTMSSDTFAFGAFFAGGVDLAGSQWFMPFTGAGSAGAQSGVGGLTWINGIPGLWPFQTYFLEFRPLTGGTLVLSFLTDSSDNIGPLLDNVLVTQTAAIPEPATWAMLIAGFGLVGGALRRRRLAAVPA